MRGRSRHRLGPGEAEKGRSLEVAQGPEGAEAAEEDGQEDVEHEGRGEGVVVAIGIRIGIVQAGASGRGEYRGWARGV